MKLFLMVTAFCLVIFDRLLLVEGHGARWLSFTGFHAVLGFLACMGLMGVAKGIGTFMVRPKDDRD